MLYTFEHMSWHALHQCCNLSHLFVLGIEVQDDGGTLFMLALAVFVCCLFILIAKKDEVLLLVNSILKRT